MQEAWRAYLELALGLTEASRKKAEKVAKKLVGKSGATAAQLQALAEELLSTSRANREALNKLVKFEVDRTLGKVGLATVEEVADLTARVRDLEEQLRQAKASPAPVPAAAAATVAANARPARKVARKAVAKKAAPAAAPEPAESGTIVAPTPPAGTTPTKKAGPAKKAATPGATATSSGTVTPRKTGTPRKAATKKAAPPPAGDV